MASNTVERESGTHNAGVIGSNPIPAIGLGDSGDSHRSSFVSKHLSDDARLTLAATLAVASQDRVAPRVEWALCRVDTGTNALRIAQKCWAPSLADASAQFRRGPYRGYPTSWVIVSVAALRTMRGMPAEASA